MMETRKIFGAIITVAVLVLGLQIGGRAVAQEPIISSFQDGYITWTNVDPNFFYTVEYRPNLTGSNDWDGSYRSAQDIQSFEDTITVPVGAFYRVVGSTNPMHTLLDAIDAVAREAASNALATANAALPAAATNGAEWGSHAELWAKGDAVTNAVDATARFVASNAQTTVDAVYGAVSNLPPLASIYIWTDAATNYFLKSADGSLSETNTSFSALMNRVLNIGWAGAEIELGPSRCADGSFVAFEIDAPITNSSQGIFTLRGQGYYGSLVRTKVGYTGAMMTITGGGAVVRFDGIQFEGDASNTNDMIALYGGTLQMESCKFGTVRGTHIRYNMDRDGSGIRSYIANTIFYSVDMLGGHSVIVLEQTNSAFTSDFKIQGCHFLTATNASALSVDGVMNRVLIQNNHILMASVAATGLVFRGGANHVIANNIFSGNTAGSSFVDFSPATSNDFRTLIVGNNTMGNPTTNLIHMNTNAYSVVLQANRWGVGQTMTLGDNINGYVLNGYGVTAQNAYRGDWGSAASNLAAGAWPSVQTNALATNKWTRPDGKTNNVFFDTNSTMWIQADTNEPYQRIGITTNGALIAPIVKIIDNDDPATLPEIGLWHNGQGTGWTVANRANFETAMSQWDAAFSNGSGFATPYIVAAAANIVLDPNNGWQQACYASAVAVTNLSIEGGTTNQIGRVEFTIYSTNTVTITNPVLTSGTWSSNNANAIYYFKPMWSTNWTARIL